MVLLLQLNAELPTDFPGHERRLYVFACRRASCRRKDGSIRALRGVRVEPGTGASNNNSRSEKKTEDEKTKAEEPKPPVTNLGETLFGAKTLGTSSSGSANPFASPNPFSGPSAPTPTTSHEAAPDTKNGASPAPAPSTGQEEMQTLPKTFAETLSLNNSQETSTHTATASAPAPAPAAEPTPHEPWPPESEQPRPYPVSYLTDAEYETLDPTPAPVSQATTTVQMDVDVEGADDPSSGSGGGKKGGKKSSGGGGQDRDVFESSMDAAFQKFADRLTQNPEQAIRYEFRGQPLLCSRADSVGTLLLGGSGALSQEAGVGVTTAARGMPRCAACGARRVFEVQLCPHAIAELEADEVSLDGMDWATVVVGVCERDCRPAGVPEGQAAYLEEWAGVQWEELTTGGRR